MDKLKVVIEAILEFLERRIPWVTLGYWIGKREASKKDAELRDLKLKLSYEENKNAVDDKYAGKSDSDIIDERLGSNSTTDQVSGSDSTKKVD